MAAKRFCPTCGGPLSLGGRCWTCEPEMKGPLPNGTQLTKQQTVFLVVGYLAALLLWPLIHRLLEWVYDYVIWVLLPLASALG